MIDNRDKFPVHSVNYEYKIIKDGNNMLNTILNKNFEELTEIEKMVIALKGAIKQYESIEEENEQKAMLSAFIITTNEILKAEGISLF